MSNFYSVLPASIQEIVQNGLLAGVFQDALVPKFLYDTIAEERPWAAQMGAVSILTRAGLMPVNATAITGSDASLASYGYEQYTLEMNQFGNSIDTNMAVSALALASKFLEDNKILGINAAQSLNQLASNSLYGAYAGGTTYVTTSSSSSTTLVVEDATGFSQVAIFTTSASGNTEGLNQNQGMALVPVSSTNPLTVSLNGVANTVTACNLSTNTLTLGTAKSATVGWVLTSAQGPVIYRATSRTSDTTLTTGDVATLALFQNAVARLRSQNVPTIGGAYTAFVPAQTVNELFQDAAFQSAYRGQGESPVYGNMALGRFSGIDWVPNELVPTVTPNSIQIYRPIVCGEGALIKGPFSEMGNLLTQLNAGATVHVEMINGVARILRAPLDRLGQVLSSTWSWIGGYSVGTDFLTDAGVPQSSGASAVYKRAVVVEHV